MKIIKLTLAMLYFLLSAVVVFVGMLVIYIACHTTAKDEVEEIEGVEESCMWVNGNGRLITVDVQKIFS